MKKLAIITTHPIQYYAPVFKLLAQQCHLKVFYTWGEDCLQNKYDPGFKKEINWDIPLLNGYNYEFLENIAKNRGSNHYKGIDNPHIIYKIKGFKPDAILVYGWNYKSHLKVLRYFKNKIPIWFRGDSTLLDEKPSLKNFAKRIYLKRIYKYIDKSFYVGTNNKAYFKKYGLKENKLVFSPHSIDNERFEKKRTDEVQLIRKKFEIQDQDILILFAGKFEHKKDPELLLDTFIDILLNNPQKHHLHLLFVGNGVLEEKLKHKVHSFHQTLSRKQHIHFLDFQNQSQMPYIYQACDLFCLPSKGLGETWGLAINEAMAAGKAILSSDKVGCAIDLVTSKNGKIFKAENFQDLKEKLLELTCNRDPLISMGMFSKKIIKDWTFSNQVISLIKELNSL